MTNAPNPFCGVFEADELRRRVVVFFFLLVLLFATIFTTSYAVDIP